MTRIPQDGLSGSSTSTSSSGGSILPSWLSALKPIARNPGKWFRTQAALFVAGGALSAIEAMTNRVSWMWFEVVIPAFASFFTSIGAAFFGPAEALLVVAGLPTDLLLDIEASLGPWAGVVVSGGAVLVFVAGYRSAEEAPGILWKIYQAIPGT